MASAPGKRKQKELTATEKVQVCEYKRKNPNSSVRVIAEKFKCGKSQVQSILAKGEEILVTVKTRMPCQREPEDLNTKTLTRQSTCGIRKHEAKIFW